jgi:glycosyltransferase involved in cell wall biosynthesis
MPKVNVVTKIAFLTDELSRYSAINNYTFSIIKELSKSFHVSVFSFAINEHFLKNNFAQKVLVNFFTNRHEHTFSEEIKTMIYSKEVVEKLRPHELLVISTDRPIPIPILLTKYSKESLKLVWDFHGMTPLRLQCPRNLRRYLIELYRLIVAKYLMKRCDFCIVHSNFIRSEVEQHYGRVPTIVVPYGIDTHRFNPNINKVSVTKKYSLHNAFTLLYVGRLVPHKRVHFIIAALAKLRDPTVRLLIVGKGSEENRLKKYAESLNLRDQVIFTGPVSDEELPRIYSASDVFVTASLHEGVCVPILESFATGKPVIVPNMTAMPETADGGGLTYNPKSIDDLVNKIKLLKNDEKLRHKLGQRGLQVVADRDIKRVAIEYKNCLEKILNY